MQQDNHLFQGMKRDNHPIRQENQYLWDALNVRFTAREEDTLLSITNEIGTSSEKMTFQGSYVGHCTIGEYLVVFTQLNGDNNSHTNYIYRVNDIDQPATLLYEGDLGIRNQIQTLGIFEGPLVQKVYWVDGDNQPRVINIVKDLLLGEPISSVYRSANDFNFVQELSLNEDITVTRDNGSGIFAPGVIQYCFTYYNKYGQESNIFYCSELQYISPATRGGNPEESVANVFNIEILNADSRFQYVRIYSIHRTSIDAVPTVKRIADIPIVDPTKLLYTDTGTTGDIVDPTKLLYIGGEDIVANTLEQKDNTLFLGNIEIRRPNVTHLLKDSGKFDVATVSGSTSRNIKLDEYTNPESFYINNHQMVQGNTSGFKSGEKYRVGIQFQYKNGKWSEPVYLADETISLGNRPSISNETDTGQILKVPTISITLKADVVELLKENGYMKARALVVYPQVQDREVLAQGMLCPTVFGIGNRKSNTPFAQSSWFIRPNPPMEYSSISNVNDGDNIDYGSIVEFRHLHGLFTGTDRGAEIQGMPSVSLSSANSSYVKTEERVSSGYMVDQSIITMHSPDIEFDDATQQALDGADLKLRIVGLINFSSNVGDIDIQTSTPTVNTGAPGFYHRAMTALWKDGKRHISGRGLTAGLFYRDSAVDDAKNANSYNAYPDVNEKEEASGKAILGWMVYPWNRSGSLNNDCNRPEGKGTRTSVLKKKRISNLKFSHDNTWLSSAYSLSHGITPVSIFNSNEVSMIKIPVPQNSGIQSIIYYGNVDTAITHAEKYQPILGADKTNLFSSKPFTMSSVPSDVSNMISNIRNISAIGDYDKGLKLTLEPIRMKYKSTPHAVFALNHSTTTRSVWNNPICLPSVNGLNKVNITEAPFWTGKIQQQEDPFKGYTIKKCNFALGMQEAPPYSDLPLVAPYHDYQDGVNKYALYEWDNYQGWVINKDRMYAEAYQKIIYTPQNETYKSLYWEVTYLGSGGVLVPFDVPTGTQLTYKVQQDNISASTKYPFLFLAELYRDEPINQFGGDSEESRRSNLWTPASKPVKLGSSATTVIADQGDTWYQRYDCLKTYPFTQEDENSIIEIASFMCETRVNIDGRYDRNRGQASNLNVSPQNFNLINKVYSQRDNFFNYRIYDKDYFKILKFPNQIVWTGEKSHLEDVDTWTNMSLVSSMDLDGNKGSVTNIVNFNDTLFCFQEKALSQLMFNSRVQIPASDGVPIEIGNGQKMDGNRIIADQVGCQDKFSMVATPNGIYFVDNLTDTLYFFNGQLNDLGATYGMSTWAKQNCSGAIHQVSGISGLRLFYDPIFRDVYFTSKSINRTALCYSEALQAFTSQYSYGGAIMIPFKGEMIALYNGEHRYGNLGLYKMFDTGYTSFFGIQKPYYISFISNDNPTMTKIFDSIEIRADLSDQMKAPFTHIRAENEYQDTDQVAFDNGYNSLKKKFRVWRALVPRDARVRNGQRLSYGKSRIRNPWTRITLTTDAEHSDKRFILHDISVKYTV